MKDCTGLEKTPFGNKQVTKINGENEQDLYVSFPFRTLEPEHSYLVKFKIRTNQANVIRVGILASPEVETKKSDDIWVKANACTDVSAILKLKDNFIDPEIKFDGEGKIGFSAYEREAGLSLEVIEPAVYDLTEIFGMGNELDVGLNNEVSKYFNYVDYMHTGKTGNVTRDISNKVWTEVKLQNDWTGWAAYRYLGNGLTEITGQGLGTGSIGPNGTTLFQLPAAFASMNTSVELAMVENSSPIETLRIRVSSEGIVSVHYMTEYEVGENNPNAGVHFNFIISSD